MGELGGVIPTVYVIVAVPIPGGRPIAKGTCAYALCDRETTFRKEDWPVPVMLDAEGAP
jgi:hypothetical protein